MNVNKTEQAANNPPPNVKISKNDSVFPKSGPQISVQAAIHQGKVQPHSHTFYEFVYVDSGFSLHSYNGRTAVLTAGDLFAVTPNNYHSYFSANNTHIYNIMFEMDELSGMTEHIFALDGVKSLFESDTFPLFKVELSRRAALTALIESIRYECKARESGWELAAKCALAQFLVMYSRLSAGTTVAHKSEKADDYLNYIYKAIDYIEENYSRSVTSDDLAKKVGLSTGYLVKQFKNKLDMSPADYIRRFRTAKALELIKTSDMPMNLIASECGFSDLSVFSRIFKQIMGNPPTYYRMSGEREK